MGRWVVATLLIGLVCTSASAATAAGPTADLNIGWTVTSGKVFAGQHFERDIAYGNAGPDATTARINVQLPSGVSVLGSTVQFTNSQCRVSGSLLQCDPVNVPVDSQGEVQILLVAAHAGQYAFTAYFDQLAASDPDTSNNTSSITVPVAAVPLTAGALALSPKHPHAGRPFTAWFRVSGGTVHSVHCKSSVGRAKARASGRRALCIVRTPSSDKGRRDRVTVVAVDGSKTFSRHRSVRLR
jgi:hypothetical protein